MSRYVFIIFRHVFLIISDSIQVVELSIVIKTNQRQFCITLERWNRTEEKPNQTLKNVLYILNYIYRGLLDFTIICFSFSIIFLYWRQMKLSSSEAVWCAWYFFMALCGSIQADSARNIHICLKEIQNI